MGRKIITGVLSLAVFVAGTAIAETESTKARGGKLYDKWYAVIGAEAPATSHPLYPADKKYADKPKANWRCKESHGLHHRGPDGAYKSVKHSSTIKGINGAAGRDTGEINAIQKDEIQRYG